MSNDMTPAKVIDDGEPTVRLDPPARLMTAMDAADRADAAALMAKSDAPQAPTAE
jgi:hypothetical protein